MLHRMEGSLSPNSFRARRVRLTEDMGHKLSSPRETGKHRLRGQAFFFRDFEGTQILRLS
jgi:hypothetical protein